jgi:sugar (pentulose or hexulose) kinase
MAAPDAVIGTVSAKAAEATGLRPGIPVIAGWNDLNAAVLGIGAIDDGQYFNITGTSEHIGRVTTDCAARAPGLICASYLPGRRLLYGVTTCGGGSIEWYRRVTRHPLEDLLVQAEKASLQNDPLLFLPYLDGERAPIWDPQASGAFLGLRTTHGQGHLVRSILEGVCFSLRQILEQVPSPSAATPGAITVAGGTARSSVWNQIKADVLNRRLDLPAHLQAGVLGAAILAAVGVKRYPDAATAAARMVRCAGRFEARTTQASELALRYAIYCEAYPALRSVFAGLRHARA